MKPITITCGVCEKNFIFRHPSVRSAIDLMHITLDCPHCAAELKAPTDSLRMISMADFLTAGYREAGVQNPEDLRKRGVLTLVPDPPKDE